MKKKKAAPVKLVVPRETANGTKYEPPFQYECTKGHVIGSSRAVDTCPAYKHGSPCTGTLVRFGKGSKVGA